MLFRTIKSSWLFGYILLPLLAASAWIGQLTSPPGFNFYYGENQTIPFKFIIGQLTDYPMLSTVLGLLLFILAAVFVQRINVEYGFFRIRSLIVGIVFILIAGGFKEMHVLHPVYFAVVFFLLAIYRLFNAFDQRKPYSQSFDATFLLGIGSLFYLNLAILLPSFVAGTIILCRETRGREVFVSIIGFLIPWIFVFSWFFLFDRIYELINLFKINIITPNDRLGNNYSELIFLGFLLFLTLIGSYLIILQYDKKKVSIRQYYLVFFLMFMSLMISFFVIPAVSIEIFIVSAIPVAFLLTNLLLSIKPIWAEIILYLLLGFNVVMHFF